jgi:hypothetical protein
MITVKDTAHFKLLRHEMWSILDIVESVYRARGLTAQITCGTDSHPDTDPHPNAFALDFGTHQIPEDQLKPMHEELIDRLGDKYTVLYNDKNLFEAVYVDTPSAHFHIQVAKAIWHEIVDKEKSNN